MLKIWDRAEQTLVGALGLAALVFALWQIVSRYLCVPKTLSGLVERRIG
jgi:TRAP-type C4-dicarboxylate transport system permease small subunit